MSWIVHTHLATTIATRTATTSTLTALHDLSLWQIRLRNLSITTHVKTDSADAHRFEIVFIVLGTLQTTQLLVSLLQLIHTNHPHLLPHGNQVLVC